MDEYKEGTVGMFWKRVGTDVVSEAQHCATRGREVSAGLLVALKRTLVQWLPAAQPTQRRQLQFLWGDTRPYDHEMPYSGNRNFPSITSKMRSDITAQSRFCPLRSASFSKP